MTETISKLQDQIICVLVRLEWNLDDFIIRSQDDSVKITRIADGKQVRVSIASIKPKCIIDDCCKWLKRLEKLILDGFVARPECQVISPMLHTISQIPGSAVLLSQYPRNPSDPATTIDRFKIASLNPTSSLVSPQALDGLTFVVNSDKTSVEPGGVVNYTYVVANNSLSRSFHLDTLVGFVRPLVGFFISIPPGAITDGPAHFTFDINRSLLPGQQLIASSTYAVNTNVPTVLDSTGVLTSEGEELVQNVQVEIIAVRLSQTTNADAVALGQSIILIIELENIGTIDAYVTSDLVDSIDPNLGEFTSYPAGAIITPNGFIIPLINTILQPGQRLTFSASYKPHARTIYTNRAQVGISQNDVLGQLSSELTFAVLFGLILRLDSSSGTNTQTHSLQSLIRNKESFTDLIPPGLVITHIFTDIFEGFSCLGTEEDLERLREEFPGAIITPDIVSPLSEFDNETTIVDVRKQKVGAFIKRTGANHSSGYDNQLADRADLNVFVIDTGIYPHADLNVVGGVNVSQPGENPDWVDRNGHGTHVAGIIGALNNKIGIVGVAPGARLWAVKTVADDGTAVLSNALAGMDWILRNRDILWTGQAVLNVSLSIPRDETIDFVVNQMVLNGLTVVVSAGNVSANVEFFSPAGSPGALTVGATGYLCYDAIANFSNVGKAVDIVAPGECILSTLPGNLYGIKSGTATSAPMVTGAVALILSGNRFVETGPALVQAIHRKLICTSKNVKQHNADGTSGCNPRINTRGKPVTDVSVWAGAF